MAINLSDTQKKVVDYTGKNLLVIAGAGSGKTRVLTERIKKLISTLKKVKRSWQLLLVIKQLRN